MLFFINFILISLISCTLLTNLIYNNTFIVKTEIVNESYLYYNNKPFYKNNKIKIEILEKETLSSELPISNEEILKNYLIII